MPDELAQLKAKIKEIACKHAADYPNIADCEAWEQLYAIDCSLEGTCLALEDWDRLVDHLGKKLYSGEWCPEVLSKEWDQVMKKEDCHAMPVLPN